MPGGSTTEDPSLAYDTASFEPILNVYQTLINYNGTTTATFVPTLATCVPGTAQCGTDYPSEAAHTTDLITYNAVTGLPENFTFVIDKNARFYDPINAVGWPVYPTDVAFSMDRTMIFSQYPYIGRYNGWVQTQSLLPIGNPAWDGGQHFPFNNTPFQELSAILVNSSVYCPASAMINANGCVTFIANGEGQDWPFFLQLVADDLGAAVEPCGWFTAQSAGLPGWAGTLAPGGDGPCGLPGDSALNPSSNDAAFQSYLTSVSTDPNARNWDAVQASGANYPNPQPNVQWKMVGSGPYSASITVGSAYTLQFNPDYAQPSGCAGLNGYAAYPGAYCDPPATSNTLCTAGTGYACTVHVTWESSAQYSGGLGYNAYVGGTADFASIQPSDANELVGLAHTSSIACTHTGNSCGAPWYHSNKVNIFQAPTISNFAYFYNMEFNYSYYHSNFPSFASPQNFPANFFSGEAARQVLTMSYPYTAVENNIWTTLGLVYQFNAGGPIPIGMGNYYPTNITYPYQVNGGNPDFNSATVGSAAWWWTVGSSNPCGNSISCPAGNPETPGDFNPYYDASLANCLNTTCKFPIESSLGFTPEDEIAADEAGNVSTATGGHVQPFVVDVNFVTSLGYLLHQNGAGAVYYLGWAPDYPDPTDYTGAYLTPNSAYGAPDSLEVGNGSGLGAAAFNQSAVCPNNGGSYFDLLYWAHQPLISQDCQGAAYNLSVEWNNIAAPLPVSAQRTLDFNLVEQVFTKLGMYAWQGQTNIIGSAAPWIATSTVNTNPTIGGGGDQLFFEVKYAHPLTVVRSGLTTGTPWGIQIGGQDYNTTNTSEIVPVPAGPTAYTALAPAGFGLAHTSPVSAAHGTVTVSTSGTTLVLIFAHESTVTITESGLPSGTSWTITLTPPATYTPTVTHQTTTGTSVSFLNVVAATYFYKVTTTPTSALADYKTVPLTVISGTNGAPLAVPNTGATVNKALAFSLAVGTVEFIESGLPAGHGTYTVSVTGTEANGQSFSESKSSVGTSGTIVLSGATGVPGGSYTWTVTNVVVASHTYTNSSGGAFSSAGTHPWLAPPTKIIHPLYHDPPAGGPRLLALSTVGRED